MKFKSKILALFFLFFHFTSQSGLENIKLIIFDCGGFAMDMRPLFENCIGLFKQKYEKYKDIEINFEQIRNKSIFKALTEDFGISWFEILCNAWSVWQISTTYVEQAPFLPEIKDSLAQLSQRYQIGIFSSLSGEMVRKKIVREGMNDVITHVFTMSMRASLLCKTGTIRNILIENGFNWSEVLYIGDEIKEIKEYKAAGLQTCAIGWGINTLGYLQEEGHDFSVSTPNELLGLLLQSS